MLKKPSAIPLIRGGVSAATMEVESTHVQTLPDGKKMIDVTMRRPHNTPRTDDKLVLPQFEDDSSSSDDDDEDAGQARHRPEYESPVKHRLNKPQDHHHGQEEDEKDNNGDAPGASTGFQGNFEWSGVQDIQTLTHANTALHEQVVDLKDQLTTLQIQLEAMAPVPGMSTAAVQDILLDKDGTLHDIRDHKIVHQAKSLRQLKRSLQREKQLAVDAVKQCKAMETAKIQLEKENETLKLKLARFQARATAAALPTVPSSEDEPQATTETVKDAKERESVAVYKTKFEDMRIKHDKLQSDLKKTQRALVREVGEDVSLDELVEGSSGVNGEQAKRGRAQQIVMLKAKVKKLEQDLTKANAATASNGSSSSPTKTSSDVDQRAQQDISAQVSQRQRMIDKLTAERDDLQERMHQLTKKFDGLKSRTQTLEKEKQEHKTKVQVLVDKSRNDDALVDALQKQLETWKGKLQEAKRARTAESSSIGSGGSGGGLPKEDRLELDRLRAMVADYKRQQQQNVNSTTNSLMPPSSEAAQFRTMAAEKERLSEQVKSLQSQLDDQERQLRSLKQSNGMEMTAPPPSRIPRLVPGSLPSSQYYPAPPASDSNNADALRKNFRDAMAGKEQEIENLKQQIQRLSQKELASQSTESDGAQQEIQDLQEENQYLRQEFDRLKTRYEAMLKNGRSANKGGGQ